MHWTRRLILAAALIAGVAPALAQVPPPVPALPDTERRTTYSITASLCSCNVNFALYGDSTDVGNWLEVFVNGVKITQSGNWTITSPANSGGLATAPRPITDAVLTFTAAQTGTVQIVGARRPRRASQFTTQPSARDFNQVLTDIIAQNRETWDKINDVTGRTVQAPAGETLTMLPALASRANMGACFDNGGNLQPCAAAGSTSFIAGVGITFTGTNPTVISTTPSITPTLGGTNKWTGDNLFGSGRPWCDVRAAGALQDGVTDDTTAIQACVTAVSAFGTGGTIYFPPSNNPSCIKTAGGVTHTSGGAIRFIGSSEGGGMSACQTDTSILTINVPFDDVEFLNILGKGVNNDTGTFGANHPTLSLGSLCVQCRIANNTIFGGSNAISVQTSDAYFENNSAGYAYGNALVYLGSNGPVVGNWFVRNKFDQLWPQGYVGTCQATAWAATTVYGLGACVSNQGFVLQNVQAGTSAGTQPTLKNYGITFNDGTAKWQIAAPLTYYSVQIDTNASENQFIQVDHTGPFTAGVAMTNSLAGTAPTHTSLFQGVIGQTIQWAVFLIAGSDVTIVSERMGGGSLTGGGTVITTTSWVGELTVSDSTILNAGTFGVILGAGTNAVISNNRIYGASDSCIELGGVLHTVISGNILGSSSIGGACTTGVKTLAPANYYNIVNNITHGAGTSVNDAAAGANKTVSGNN